MLEFRDSRFDENNDPSSALDENGASWLEAMFTNNTDKSNSVILTLNANLAIDSGAFISSVAFNLTENASISSVCINPANCTAQDFTFERDNINIANGISGLDLRLNFPTKKNDRLDLNDPISFIITGTNLNFSSFNSFVNIGGEDVYAAARLQGYGMDINGDGDGDSSSTIYSAPGPLPILGVAAAFRTSRRLRRRLTSARLASGRPPAHRPA